METYNLNTLVVDTARTEFATMERASGPLPFLQAAHTESAPGSIGTETTRCEILAFLQLVETNNPAMSLELLPYSNIREQHRCMGLASLANAHARCFHYPTTT